MSGMEHASTTCAWVIFHLWLLFLILHAGLPLTRIALGTAGGAVAIPLRTETHKTHHIHLLACHRGKESSSGGVSLLECLSTRLYMQ